MPDSIDRKEPPSDEELVDAAGELNLSDLDREAAARAIVNITRELPNTVALNHETALGIVDRAQHGSAGLTEVASDEVQRLIDERNELARNQILRAQAHKNVDEDIGLELKEEARAFVEERMLLPEESFIYCWWVQYYAEGGDDEPPQEGEQAK